MRSRNSARSPNRRQAINEELNQHTQRIRDLMQEDLTFLEEENARLLKRCDKSEQLQSKIQLIVKHNEELYTENKRFSILVKEKLQENQLLVHKLNQNRNWDYERKQLYRELQNLRNEIDQVESIKSLTIKQIKTKNKIQKEQMIDDNEKGILLFENQLRKLKEKLDFKEQELKKIGQNRKVLEDQLQSRTAQLNNKLQQNKLETKKAVEEVMKELDEKQSTIREKERVIRQIIQKNDKEVDGKDSTIKDKERLIKQIIQKKDKEIQQKQYHKQKLRDTIRDCQSQITALKREIDHLRSQIQDNKNRFSEAEQEMEARHSKNALLKKHNSELQQKNQQLLNYTQQLQNSIQNYKRDISGKDDTLKEKDQQIKNKIQEINKGHKQIDNIKNKMKELNIINERQIEDVKTKMEEIYNQEIIDLKLQAEKTQNLMASDIAKLEDELNFRDTRICQFEQQLDAKNRQICYLSDEQSEMKTKFLQEGKVMKQDLQGIHLEYQQIQTKNRDKIKKLELQIRNLNEQIGTITQQVKKKSIQLQEQKTSSTYLKQQSKHSASRNQQKYNVMCKQIDQWKSKYQTVKSALQKQRDESLAASAQKFNQDKETIKNCEEQLRKWRERFMKLEDQNQSLKQFIGKRDKIIHESEDKISKLYEQLQQREDLIDSLRAQMLQIEAKNKQKYQQRKNILGSSYQDNMLELRSSYEIKITVMENQLDILNKQLKDREEELNELLKQYKRMRDQMITITEQQANKKNITLKYAGSTAETIATKNMFDVFIKSKVLDYCSDALQEAGNKQNFSVNP